MDQVTIHLSTDILYPDFEDLKDLLKRDQEQEEDKEKWQWLIKEMGRQVKEQVDNSLPVVSNIP